MEALYTAVATARGGREGEVVSDDGVIDLELGIPKDLGGPDSDKTNPEQLFAAGYAACFHSALRQVARRKRIDVDGSEITAKVSLGLVDKQFLIEVSMIGRFPGMSQEQARELMEGAHQVCPYSHATRGNLDVDLTVET